MANPKEAGVLPPPTRQELIQKKENARSRLISLLQEEESLTFEKRGVIHGALSKMEFVLAERNPAEGKKKVDAVTLDTVRTQARKTIDETLPPTIKNEAWELIREILAMYDAVLLAEKE